MLTTITTTNNQKKKNSLITLGGCLIKYANCVNRDFRLNIEDKRKQLQ